MSDDQLDDLAIKHLKPKGKLPRFTIRTRAMAWVELRDMVFERTASETDNLMFYKALVRYFQEKYPTDAKVLEGATLESVQRFLQIAWTTVLVKRELRVGVCETLRVLIDAEKLKRSLAREISPDPQPDSATVKALEKLISKVETLEEEVKVVKQMSQERQGTPLVAPRALGSIKDEEELTELGLEMLEEDDDPLVVRPREDRKVYVSQARREVNRVSRSAGRVLEHERLEIPSLIIDELRLLQVSEWPRIGMQTLWTELRQFFTDFHVPAKDNKGLAIKREIKAMINARGGLSKMIPMLFKAGSVHGHHSEEYLALAQLCDDNVRELLRKRDVATHGGGVSRQIVEQTHAMNVDLPDYLKARAVILASVKKSTQDFQRPASAPGGKKGKAKAGVKSDEGEE
jgi:hypothetical protein